MKPAARATCGDGPEHILARVLARQGDAHDERGEHQARRRPADDAADMVCGQHEATAVDQHVALAVYDALLVLKKGGN